MIEEITKKDDWNAVLQEVDTYDFYHTYDYHMLSKPSGAKCMLLVYRNDHLIIALPLITRSIKETEYYDVTSVYGYAGPLSKNLSANFNNDLFVSELNTHFLNHKIVSAFSRLNPFVDHQKVVLRNMGDYVEMSSVVTIDLTNDLMTQRQGYQRRIKSQINKARRLCGIKKASTNEDVNAFVDIYYETMDRVNADESYYFERKYFCDFLESTDFETDVLLATDNKTNQIIAGAMFVKTNHIVQYHLSGTKSAFLDIMPVKMLIDEMRLTATEKGFKYLNLGGGLGSKEDSLLRFKMSFSKEMNTFSVWKYIVDAEIYNSLLSNAFSKSTDYFPAYRAR